MALVYIEAILMVILAMAAIVSLYCASVLYQKKYAHHVVHADHPTKLQQKLLKSPYKFFLCTLLFVALLSWFLVSHLNGPQQEFFFGLFITLFSMALGHALGTLLVFLYSIKNAEKMSGQVVFEDKKFRIVHIQAAFMACLILLFPLAIIQNTPFMWGSLVAVLGLQLHLGQSLFRNKSSFEL